MKYEGKRAVVTGGTHGMGLAVVRALLDGGAEVLLTGRDVSPLAGKLPGTAHLLSSTRRGRRTSRSWVPRRRRWGRWTWSSSTSVSRP